MRRSKKPHLPMNHGVLAKYTEGTLGVAFAYMQTGAVLIESMENEFHNRPDVASLLSPSGNIHALPHRNLDKWFLSEIASHPHLMFHQAIEESLKALWYNDNQRQHPKTSTPHNCKELLEILPVRRIAEIEAKYTALYNGTDLYTDATWTVRKILVDNEGVYRDLRYQSQFWDNEDRSGKIRDPKHLWMAASSISSVLMDVYLNKHLQTAVEL